MKSTIFSISVLFSLAIFLIPISSAVVSHGANQVFFNDQQNLQAKFDSGALGQWDDVTGGINYADGNVGVGITTPNSHVTGKAFIVKGAAGLGDGRGIIEVHSSGFNQRALLEQVGQITYVGNLGDASMNWINGNDLNVIVGGGKTAITILGANGNVGIGTTAPITKQQIGDPFSGVASGWPTSARQGIMIGQDSDNMYIGLIDEGSNADQAAIVFGDDAEDYFRILRNDPNGNLAELMRVNYGGSVTIGTSTPASGAKLTVAGNVNIAGNALAEVRSVNAMAAGDNLDIAYGQSNNIYFKSATSTGRVYIGGDGIQANKFCMGSNCITSWPSGGHGNGANCNAGNAPLGVDANGAVEDCWAVAAASHAHSQYITTESDPTVPANIKDGVSWSEVSGKPNSFYPAINVFDLGEGYAHDCCCNPSTPGCSEGGQSWTYDIGWPNYEFCALRTVTSGGGGSDDACVLWKDSAGWHVRVKDTSNNDDQARCGVQCLDW